MASILSLNQHDAVAFGRQRAGLGRLPGEA
jgi:hypothetical protein